MGHVVDAVWVIGSGSHFGDEEARYSVRSAHECLDGLRSVWIVGQLPAWAELSRVRHVPCDDPLNTKDGNIIRKLLAACDCAGLSDDFVFFSDDQVLLRPVTFEQLGPYHMGDLATRSRWASAWWNRMRATRDWLHERRCPTMHGDTHVPLPMRKDVVKRVFADSTYWGRRPGLCVGTTYLNVGGARARPMGERRAVVTQRCGEQALRLMLAGRWFLNFNDVGFSQVLSFLRETFPRPSPYEREYSTRVTGPTPAAPRLTVIIPTIGRQSLARALESVRAQALEDDEVIVAQDGRRSRAVEEVARAHGAAYVTTGKARSGDPGHTASNCAMTRATRDYVARIDDDDAYLPGALDAVRAAALRHPDRPLLFRMSRGSWAPPVWRSQSVVWGNVSTQMIVTPNVQGKLGEWGPYHAGDLAFICTTLERWPADSVVWCRDVLVNQESRGTRRREDRRTVHNLVYHVYPVRDNPAWRENVERLSRSWDLFDGRRIIGVRTDELTDSPQDVLDALPDQHRVELVAGPNDPLRGETPTFLEGMSRLRSWDSEAFTFYAHAKGVKPAYHAESPEVVKCVRRWREFMYRHCLESRSVASLDAFLRHFTCAGCLRIRSNYRHEEGRPASAWHYSGTFFWVNHAQFFSLPDALALGPSRFAVERHLGEIVPDFDAGVLAADDVQRVTCWMYTIDSSAWDVWEAAATRAISLETGAKHGHR